MKKNKQNWEIKIGNKEDIPNILKTIDACLLDLQNKNIYQWNENYPNEEIINSDIANKNLYIIKSKNVCIAIVVINEVHDEQWKSIEWSKHVKKPLIVHRLIVHPQFQNLGIGYKMINFILEFCKMNKFDSIRFDVFSKNEKAINLYEKFHCEKKGEVYFPNRKDVFFCYELNL